MTTYTIHAAKTHLSRLIEQACAGEDIVIARGKEPLVRLVPLVQPPRGRVFGAMRGHASPARYACLDDEIKRYVLANSPNSCRQLIALTKQCGGYDNISLGIFAIRSTTKTTQKLSITRSLRGRVL